MGKEYTKEMAIEQIKHCYKENGMINAALYASEKRKPGVTWIKNHFGSWKKAVKKAELNNMHIIDYSEEFLIEQLRKCADENDGKISYERYKHSDLKPSVDYIVNYFGRWNQALKKAGLKEEESVKHYTDEEVIEGLTECYQKYGKITRRLYAEFSMGKEYPSPARIAERFGSWNKGLEKANIPINKVGKQKYTKEQIIEGVQKCYKENNNDITMRIYEKWQENQKEYPVIETVVAYFDSWLELLKIAGINYTKERYTDEEVLKMFKDNLNKMNGEFKTGVYMGKNFSPSLAVLKGRFGSIENALGKIKSEVE